MHRFIFVFAFFLFNYCCAQPTVASHPLVLSNISEQNGLSDDHVRSVLKDRDGFVWIGTTDGLNLADGSSIHVFRKIETDSSSLPDNNIVCFAEDSEGIIYIGTTRGLCWYDKKKKNFTPVNLPPSPYGASGVIQKIIPAGNKIWCATDGGLFMIDRLTKKTTFFYNNSTEQGTDIKYSNKLNCMLMDENKQLWISSTDGLWRFNIATGVYTKIIHRNNDPYYHPLCLYVYEDHEKNIWAGFWNTGLKKFDTHTGSLTDYGNSLHQATTVSCITEIKQPDSNYVLWLNNNLRVFDEKKKLFYNFQSPLAGKKVQTVSPVYQSADGWVWLASDNGLYIYDPQRQVFDHHYFKSNITSQGVSFYNYKNGILIGAEDSAFLKWTDRKGNFLKDYSYLGNRSSLLCIREDEPGDFWIGTNNGILHTHLATGDKKWFRHKEGDSTTLPRDFITTLLVDSKKNLWVFPWRNGIWQMNKQTGQCTKLFDGFMKEVDQVKKLLISDAVEDASGNIWMSDLDEGIILYNASSKQFSKPFEKQLGSRYGAGNLFIKGRDIYSHLADALIKWNIDSIILHKIALPAELNKGLSNMYPDKLGNWWLASKNGLIVFNEKENTFKRFTTGDGLAQNDVDATLFCTDDNTMIIGANNYFSFFKPGPLINASLNKKNAILTEIRVNNKIIDGNPDAAISLGYKENNIVIRWALPDYGNPLRNQYYVKMEDIDEDWHYVGNLGEVQYANLSDGHYSIRLKAATANGVASENIIHLKFIIHPPIWKRGWFITLLSLILLSSFILIVRYISQRNLKEKLLRLEKEQAIEKERNRISRDMHDDLGSGLTKIAILSEVVKKQLHDPEKAKQQLETIGESSRELVDNLQDIIWVLNPKNDTLESLAAYIREYALKFFEPFGTIVQFNYPERFSDTRLSEETRRSVFLTIKETFNNTGKHAWNNNILISIEQSPSSILIKIEDDGKGFDTRNTRQFGNGLTNMKNRIEQLGGVFKIESEPEKGTRTMIEIRV